VELPAGVNPCGEWGEYHMFFCRCPEVSMEIAVSIGEIVEREGFWFADLSSTETSCDVGPG
jgi:diphthamide synthase (EF-2-diphthine--ammonia ligase)